MLAPAGCAAPCRVRRRHAPPAAGAWRAHTHQDEERAVQLAAFQADASAQKGDDAAAR